MDVCYFMYKKYLIEYLEYFFLLIKNKFLCILNIFFWLSERLIVIWFDKKIEFDNGIYLYIVLM